MLIVHRAPDVHHAVPAVLPYNRPEWPKALSSFLLNSCLLYIFPPWSMGEGVYAAKQRSALYMYSRPGPSGKVSMLLNSGLLYIFPSWSKGKGVYATAQRCARYIPILVPRERCLCCYTAVCSIYSRPGPWGKVSRLLNSGLLDKFPSWSVGKGVYAVKQLSALYIPVLVLGRCLCS